MNDTIEHGEGKRWQLISKSESQCEVIVDTQKRKNTFILVKAMFGYPYPYTISVGKAVVDFLNKEFPAE